jgi:hypothetical protein
MGLGLAITKNLVELHRGTIRAESGGAKQGSTFTIEFPLVSKNADEHARPADNMSGSDEMDCFWSRRQDGGERGRRARDDQGSSRVIE